MTCPGVNFFDFLFISRRITCNCGFGWGPIDGFCLFSPS